MKNYYTLDPTKKEIKHLEKEYKEEMEKYPNVGTPYMEETDYKPLEQGVKW